MDEPPAELARSIASFVAGELGLRSEEMSLGIAINSDLGLSGTDVDEFLEAFCRRFSVDTRGRSKLAGYFEKSAPVTIRDLVHAVDQRAWGQI